ncbi:hypothetical protein ARMGADRAFT_1075182 [Armillaria gallica]|uniref:Uncharacterized protein n=1 Tax=Armillaria gallica TaxID=47427 RepID=A0A2H3DSX6_ARMGA|nr:hypothetical protein ARMGADRAFT_1075182 [Armillaria gallica]
MNVDQSAVAPSSHANPLPCSDVSVRTPVSKAPLSISLLKHCLPDVFCVTLFDYFKSSPSHQPPAHSDVPSTSSSVRANNVPVTPDPVITTSAHSGKAGDEPSFWMDDAGIDQNGAVAQRQCVTFLQTQSANDNNVKEQAAKDRGRRGTYSEESSQDCSRRTRHSSCRRTHPVSAATFAPNTSSTLPMTGRPTSLCRCGEKIVPMRGNMTALRAGTGLDDGWLGTRSFILGAPEDRWEYLTQQPPNTATPGEKLHAEFMLGGGIEMGMPSFFDAVG